MNRRRLLFLTLTAAFATLGAAWPASGTPSVAKNLVVTPAVRLSLFDAAAAYHQLPTKDYLGLNKGVTYYAFDEVTKTYYAGAGLDPSPNSLKAQAGAQDDGGYNLFVRARSAKKWTVYNDGLGGSSEATCPITIPRAVLAVWDWSQSCFPPLS